MGPGAKPLRRLHIGQPVHPDEAVATLQQENARLRAALQAEWDWWECVRWFGLPSIAPSAITIRRAALTAALEGHTQ